MTHSALIIDDEADIRELIAMSLDRMGINTHTARNLSEARELLATYTFEVCLTDMKLPDGCGVEFVKYALAIQPELPVAVITAYGNMDAAVNAMKNGAFDFVSKPVDLSLLRSLVVQALKVGKGQYTNKLPSSDTTTELPDGLNTSAATPQNVGITSPSKTGLNPRATLSSLHDRRETDSAKDELLGLDRLIGHSEPMMNLKNMITKVAKTNAPVWITGESGTGKELIARLIHENGPRSGLPFVAINCGAIPSELMESEMFGHRKGSFTGAHSDHDGLFKRAEGGTLFFDEVAELPLHMQVKLLRAIQERSVRPVGGADELPTNVRVLSASHKDLAIEVEQGSFRHDLYYRLNVISIKSPSLRQRREDVALIARHALRSIASAEGSSQSMTLTTEAEEILSNYAFPGNVRELENILERAVALSDSKLIEATDLNLPLVVHNQSSPFQAPSTTLAANDSTEFQHIINALNKARWNRKVAAEQLGMTYRQLRYRIQQYGIDKLQSNNR